MKKNLKATSIIEALIMIVILTFWILWLYDIYIKSYYLSISTKNKIQAIEMAREWIEAMENIRNTNWVLLWADPKNCWNSFNYDINCVGSDNDTYDIKSWLYKIYPDSNWKWLLEAPNTTLNSKDYSDSTYRDFFRIRKDNNWLYTQSWWTDFYPIFTREINISYSDSNWDWTANSNDEVMNVNSIVMWKDSHWNEPHIVELQWILTNWKK